MSTGLPTISIVTPSYNQAAYLEETIQSVLGQGYPHLEYIIIDGGSTDESVAIIKRYQDRLTYWQSARDGGMYNAVNMGMAHATGELLGWLNSDDFYFPGTLHYVAASLSSSQPELLFGNAFHFVQDRSENWGSDVLADSKRASLARYDYVIQPSTFWTRAAWVKTGPLDESFQFTGDWEWFARAENCGVIFKPTARYLSTYRIYSGSKTSSGRDRRWQEEIRILEKYAGPEYAATFEQVTHARDRILKIRNFIHRWHLSRLDRIVFRAAFPQIFRHYQPREIWDMIEMIGYS